MVPILLPFVFHIFINVARWVVTKCSEMSCTGYPALVMDTHCSCTVLLLFSCLYSKYKHCNFVQEKGPKPLRSIFIRCAGSLGNSPRDVTPTTNWVFCPPPPPALTRPLGGRMIIGLRLFIRNLKAERVQDGRGRAAP